MKRVCWLVLPLVAFLAIVIGRVRTGSGAWTARQASEVAAEYFFLLLEQQGLETESFDFLSEIVARFLEPGAYLTAQLGMPPDGPVAFALAFSFSWWLWLAVPRTIFFALGIRFGFAGMGCYRWWLLAGPPWRPIYRVWISIRRFFRQFRFGKRATACWTRPLSAMTLPFNRRDAVFVGHLWWHGLKMTMPIGIRGKRHIAVVASSGAGKTRWAKGWLGMLPKQASAFVIDCDGDIVNTLGPSAIRRGHKLINLDPFGLSNLPTASWNVIDELDRAVKRHKKHGRKVVVRYAKKIAEAVVPETNSTQPIFTRVAREFVCGVILYVWLFEPPKYRNMVRVRELIARGMPELVVERKQDAFDLFLRRMEDAVNYEDDCNGMITDVIARAAGSMRSGKGREGNPFRTTALSATSFLDLPEIVEISRHSDFTSEELKRSNPWVFVVAPVVDIQSTLSGWVRMLTMMTLYTFQNIPGGRRVPCAFLLDEFPSLGRIESFETAAPVFRKYGVRLVVITQDLELLEQVYPKCWEGFIGNAQATLWMGTDHQRTAKYLSELLGKALRKRKIQGDVFSKVGPRIEHSDEFLLTTDQVRETLDPDRGQIIVTRTGKTPLLVSCAGYDRVLPVWRYEPSSEHREPILRRLTRSLVGSLCAHRG